MPDARRSIGSGWVEGALGAGYKEHSGKDHRNPSRSTLISAEGGGQTVGNANGAASTNHIAANMSEQSKTEKPVTRA